MITGTLANVLAFGLLAGLAQIVTTITGGYQPTGWTILLILGFGVGVWSSVFLVFIKRLEKFDRERVGNTRRIHDEDRTLAALVERDAGAVNHLETVLNGLTQKVTEIERKFNALPK